MFILLNTTIKICLKIIFYVVILSIVIGLIISILTPIGYKDYINKYSNEYDIDPYLIAAIINVESKYNKEAISTKKAKGLMQIGPNTGEWGAKELGIEGYTEEMLFDPELNIRIGTWYLRQLKGQFDSDLRLVLAAYNAGSGNVSKWLVDKNYSYDGIKLSRIPFKETEEYLERVENNYKIYKLVYKFYMEKPDSINSLYIDAIISFRGYLRNILKSLREEYFEI